MEIRPLTRRVLTAGGTQVIRVVERLGQTEQSRRCRPWFAVDGDHTLRLDYELDETSVVLDVGGFEGQWASDIFARSLATVHVFEPVPSAAARVTERFAANPKVHVHPVGLAGADESAEIVVQGDRSSTHTGSGPTEPIRLVAAAPFLAELGIDRIDLLKVNIEGGEYDLLEHLLDEGILGRVTDVQVQFHDFVPDAEQRMRSIQRRLAETHDPTWQFEFVWENWRRRAT